ncbi:MAG: 4-hydroxythreonine-4-phosphate dehydrogenase PdxA [Burkholderiaceae bacterium]
MTAVAASRPASAPRLASPLTAPIALTTGEPAGIGPEIALKAALAVEAPVVLLGDAGLLEATAQQHGLPWPLPARVRIDPIPLATPAQAGRLDARNGRYVLRLLERACDGCLAGEFAAIATAPVQKSVINEAGVPFTGHTEFLAERSHTPQVVMMLVGGLGPTAMRVALATTHLPLRAVPDAITGELLAAVIDILAHDLRTQFGLAAPRIAVTGLNPHAGEGGHLGREEIEVIAPAIAAAQARGIDATGPWPADTIFVAEHLAHFDAVLAMFHDQGLPVLKHASFGQGVNVTLGLPFVRTSVDHGTALDLAGSGRANAGSMVAALKLATQLAHTRITETR